MKRRIDRLERSAAQQQPGSCKVIISTPPDDLSSDQYDTWAAEVDAEALRMGHRVIKLNLGPLGQEVPGPVKGEEGF